MINVMQQGKNIIKQVAKEHDVEYKDIIGRSRQRYILTARRDAWHRMWHNTELTQAEIAMLTNTTRQTVVEGISTFEKKIQENLNKQTHGGTL